MARERTTTHELGTKCCFPRALMNIPSPFHPLFLAIIRIVADTPQYTEVHGYSRIGLNNDTVTLLVTLGKSLYFDCFARAREIPLPSGKE
jgi:hypothetical protein